MPMICAAEDSVLVTDKAKADLILRLSLKPLVSIVQGIGGTRYHTYLEVLDSRSGETLYSDESRRVEGMIKVLRKRIEAQEKQPGGK
jgi:hypothetical protein